MIKVIIRDTEFNVRCKYDIDKDRNRWTATATYNEHEIIGFGNELEHAIRSLTNSLRKVVK